MASKTAKTASVSGAVDNDQIVVDSEKGIAFDFKIKGISLNFNVQYEKTFVRNPGTDAEVALPSEQGSFNDAVYIDMNNEVSLNDLLTQKPWLLDIVPLLTAQVTQAYQAFNDPTAAEARKQKKNEA